VQTLRHTYRVLDGSKAPTPADDVSPLLGGTVRQDPREDLPARRSQPDGPENPRFMVIASTGVRPAELKRAEQADVDLERKAWIVRTA
jgi:hypothetical protein